MRFLFAALVIILILYLLKAPSIVAFVHSLIPLYNATIDTLTHFRERHPFMFISLYFILLYLMRPEKRQYSDF